MLAVKNFAVSKLLRMTAVLMTLVYIPNAIMSAYAADSIASLVANLGALALNGTMCLGMWYLSIAGSSAGAEIIRITIKIRRVLLWILAVLYVLFAILAFGQMEEIFSFDTREETIVSFVILSIAIYAVATLVMEFGITKHMCLMMEDIRNRLTREVDYGFEFKLAGWSIFGIVVGSALLLFTGGMMVFLMLYMNSFGLLDYYFSELSITFDISDWIGIIQPVFMIGMYICYLLMARRYRTIVPRETL